jgi:NAD(P)-dependent dehydrogenase (short-subunit alcohol dehydrogenase family)
MRDLDGKVAVITGSGSERGIGKATASLLASQGVKLVLADLNGEALEASVKDLQGHGADVIGVQTDVADYASVKNLATQAFDHFGKVHIAFLNAGIGGGGSLFDDDMEGWDRVIGVNFLGVLHGIKALVPRMLEHGEPGHVLATSSGAGATGVMYTGAGYATTKQAVCTLMECLYGQLRDMGSALRATVVFPPLTKTNLAGNPDFMTFVAQGLEAGGVPAPLAEPEEVAQTVLDAILEDSFWAHQTVEQDARYTDGRMQANIEWEHDILRARCDALINRTAPDPYLWGGSGARS